MRELVDASIQIIDHMEESGATATHVQQIKHALQQQAGQLSNSAGGSFTHLESSIGEIVQMVEQLEGQARESYNDVTGNAIEQFEMKSLNDQLHASHAYNEKIDYKSLKKVRSNLEEVRSLANS